MRLFSVFAIFLFAGFAFWAQSGQSLLQRPVDLPMPTVQLAPAKGSEVAVLAGGCFWGMEAVFESLKGVSSVTSGYAGGKRSDATYDKVSSETTGHAEAVRIVYDPAKVTFEQLLQVYFSVAHDPTQLNRQGPDKGPSYRSAIFPQTAAQRTTANDYIAKLMKARSFSKPIVTKIESGAFYAAEAYHQDYARRNPNDSYIVTNDAPKVRALKAKFPNWVR